MAIEWLKVLKQGLSEFLDDFKDIDGDSGLLKFKWKKPVCFVA